MRPTRQKRIFLGIAILFVLLLGYASYDIASRTTFPGSKPQLRERILQNFVVSDSLQNADTANSQKGDSLGKPNQ
jgi:hypothetical protein